MIGLVDIDDMARVSDDLDTSRRLMFRSPFDGFEEHVVLVTHNIENRYVRLDRREMTKQRIHILGHLEPADELALTQVGRIADEQHA